MLLLCLWLLLKQEKTETLAFLTNKMCGQCLNILGSLSIIGPIKVILTSLIPPVWHIWLLSAEALDDNTAIFYKQHS